MATVDGRADLLGRYTTQFGDPARVGDRLPGWLAVTAAGGRGGRATVLRPEDRVTLIYLPEEAVA